MLLIENIFSEFEIKNIKKTIEEYNWKFEAQTVKNNGVTFWIKPLMESPLKSFFEDFIPKKIGKNILINELYLNGQAFGQCGSWHLDNKFNNDLTLICFLNEWLPEYGGHFMLKKESEICSILPKYNRAVLFESKQLHMGLGPSRHCTFQRESLAVKFTVYE